MRPGSRGILTGAKGLDCGGPTPLHTCGALTGPASEPPEAAAWSALLTSSWVTL